MAELKEGKKMEVDKRLLSPAGLESLTKDFCFEYERKTVAQYVAVLRECIRQFEILDKGTSYYPIIELTEWGTPGRFMPDHFGRGWVIRPRRWDDASKEQLQAKLQEYSALVEKYAARIVELQEILARRD